MSEKVSNKGSQIARNIAARLAAVQAVYQMKENEQDAKSVVSEYVSHRLGEPVDQQAMVLPDGVLFKNIVNGVCDREQDLRHVIDTFMESHNGIKASNSKGFKEPLLDSVILCGAYELLAHHDIDAPIIISDYLDVTHAFYEGGESKFVNAALDHVKRAFRES